MHDGAGGGAWGAGGRVELDCIVKDARPVAGAPRSFYYSALRSLDCHPKRRDGGRHAMQRAMLSALLVVCFIGPAHPQGVQAGANQGGSVKDRPRFNQARFEQAMGQGGIRGQKTTPGGPPDAEPNAKKKAKQERCG